MKILISNYSSLPIYEQIREQIKEAILKGEIEPGSMLPSIRVLASQCKVGVITVKRAYEELEKEGLIFNRQGKGCFVKEINQEEVIKLYEQQLKEQIKELRRFCKEHAISETRMLALIEECKEEE
ncbi:MULTISPECIES: GntR family transcriptional regulator [Erysipelotrichaceae]|uniref:GntR family transcriptional regulator n=1 Tax=Amedibacillus hominis TaxID=2897776 RepID=A0ABS9R635_9FIRM|nr:MULTISPECIES: GntR family transcriptional regulator [Erysipelotrichaceae]MCH4285112.1 GntR family transcriptional regulator [Amedibacillus hominis]RGC50917.1 GntR family transcriptional regulator [Absiella sp. AM29-15]